MRTLVISISILSLIFLAFITFSFYSKRTLTVVLPPDSLKQWYKPANKRQVWLHVMFKLRREMQAISEYAATGDQPHLLKWTEKLVRDYKKAGEMVPEWKQAMKIQLAEELLDAAQKNNRDKIKHTQQKLDRVCQKCHDKYRAITAVIYRSADFSKIRLPDTYTNKPLTYKEEMKNFSKAINRIVIGITDQKFDAAQSSAKELETRMDNFAHSCDKCHKDNAASEAILGNANKVRFAELGRLLQSKNAIKAGRTVGEIAVTACARCHSIHRATYDLRDVFQ